MEDSFLPLGVCGLILSLTLKGIERSLLLQSEREEHYKDVLSSGVNIDLNVSSSSGRERVREEVKNVCQAAWDKQEEPLVCVKGVVKTLPPFQGEESDPYSHDHSIIRNLDDRPCVVSLLSSTEHFWGDEVYEKSRKIQQVPWCLTSYDSRGLKIAVDDESVRQALLSDFTRQHREVHRNRHFKHPRIAYPRFSFLNGLVRTWNADWGYLRFAGSSEKSRSWWEALTLQPKQQTLCYILPLLSKCSIVGSITLNTDGEYLLTAHSKFGFFLFGDIPFLAASSSLGASSQFLKRCALHIKYINSLIMFSLVCSAGWYLYSRYQSEWHVMVHRWFNRIIGMKQGQENNDGCEEDNSHNDFDSVIRGNDTACVICLSAPRTVFLRPCLHLCLCLTCYLENYDASSEEIISECPICRVQVTSYEAIYNP